MYAFVCHDKVVTSELDQNMVDFIKPSSLPSLLISNFEACTLLIL